VLPTVFDPPVIVSKPVQRCVVIVQIRTGKQAIVQCTCTIIRAMLLHNVAVAPNYVEITGAVVTLALHLACMLAVNAGRNEI
jgi:hypothetical protein